MSYQAKFNAKPLTERGKKILLAAQSLFLEHGFDNTSLEMIISHSGGSRRNIYSEFGNKQGLLLAVMHHEVSAQVSTLEGIDYQLPPQQALIEVFTRFMQGMMSETLIGMFRVVTHMVPTLPEVGELIYEAGPLTGCRPVVRYLSHLNEQGILAIDDAKFAAQLLVEMVKARPHLQAILVPAKAPSRQEVQTHIEKAVEVFLRAYAP